MSNRIYTLIVDHRLDIKLRELQEGLGKNEEIIAQSTVKLPDGRSKLIITTKEARSKTKNLLLEEAGLRSNT